MEKNLFKKGLLEACIQNCENQAENAKAAMEETQKMANEYGAPKDRYDSFRTQLLRKRDLYAEQYQKALNELELIKKAQEIGICSEVQFGAAVITNMQKLFIVTGIGKFNYDKEDWYAISTAVPVFEAIKGKRKGDSVSFNGRKIEIADIF